MTKIKICGLRRSEDIEYVNKLKPDYIGFVFAKKSRRFLTDAKAARLKEQLLKEIIAVGVFVDDDIGHIVSLADTGVIDMVQLHGKENDDYIQSLRKELKKSSVLIIKAFSISSREDVNIAVNSSADYILLDNVTGGSGTSFDWDVIEDINRPFFLAGGLNNNNIELAISKVNPMAVDVSSGVEIHGYKDYSLMKQFMRIVKNET